MADFTFASSFQSACKGAHTVLVLVPARRLADGWLKRAIPAPWCALLEKAAEGLEPGPMGCTVSSVNPGEGPARIALTALPDDVSRHASPTRLEMVALAAASTELNGKGGAVIACLEDPDHVLGVARGVARTMPLFTRATNAKGGRTKKTRVSFLGLDADAKPVRPGRFVKAVVNRARWAAMLVDTPTAQMTTADFEKATRKAARGIPNLVVTSITGSALLEKKLGGIHAVGRTAKVAPRLLLLKYRPPKAKRHVGFVGKGVVYDTGGLSLKPTAGMSGMKCDMGGAAAAVAATLALAESGAKEAVTCAAPLAENAIGPDAYRPDDILAMHSGKTVEINNTDAEGRLLLADGVSYVARKFRPDVVIDAATLTGAAVISTGIRHAAIVSNRAGLEARAVEIGRATGDLAHPLPFAPEFFQQEFKSKVADMRNSVANRMNAQSSCAAQFVYSHVQDLNVPWLHVDLAGPAFLEQRGTGFGVALLASLARGLDKKTLTD